MIHRSISSVLAGLLFLGQSPAPIVIPGDLIVQGKISTSDTGPTSIGISGSATGPVTMLTGSDAGPMLTYPDGTTTFVTTGEAGNTPLNVSVLSLKLKGTYTKPPSCIVNGWGNPARGFPSIAGNTVTLNLRGVQGDTVSWSCTRVTQ